MATIAKLAEELVDLKVKEVQELLEILKNDYNIEPAAAAPVAVAAAAPAEAEEKSEFDVWIKDIGINKMNLIKAVKAATGVSLIDAKKLVDGHADAPIKKSVAKAEAEAMAGALKEAGATIELK